MAKSAPGCTPSGVATALDTEFNRGLGLYDATMVVVGSMIGSGIFIVSADMARQLGSPGWLLVAWVVTGRAHDRGGPVVRRAGGDDAACRRPVRLPARGVLAAVGLPLWMDALPRHPDRHDCGRCASRLRGFSACCGRPSARDHYIVAPVHLSAGYALSLSTAQLVGVLLIALLTWSNTRGLEYGKVDPERLHDREDGRADRPHRAGAVPRLERRGGGRELRRVLDAARPGRTSCRAVGGHRLRPVRRASAWRRPDRSSRPTAWNNVTFTAGEVKDPRRNLPLSLALGTGAVITLYLLANVAYIVTLPLRADPARAVRPRRNGHARRDLARALGRR